MMDRYSTLICQRDSSVYVGNAIASSMVSAD
jgi:hypothetical protein